MDQIPMAFPLSGAPAPFAFHSPDNIQRSNNRANTVSVAGSDSNGGALIPADAAPVSATGLWCVPHAAAGRQ